MTATTGLPPRLRDVLLGIANGRTMAQIAQRLCLSEDAVKARAQALYRQLDARDRGHAIGVAFRTGLLTPEQIQPVPVSPVGPAAQGLIAELRAHTGRPQTCWVVQANACSALIVSDAEGHLRFERMFRRTTVDTAAAARLVRVGELSTIPAYAGGPGRWMWRTGRMGRPVGLTRQGAAA